MMIHLKLSDIERNVDVIKCSIGSNESLERFFKKSEAIETIEQLISLITTAVVIHEFRQTPLEESEAKCLLFSCKEVDGLLEVMRNLINEAVC